MKNSNTLLIWDSPEKAPSGNWLTAFWQTFDVLEHGSSISIPLSIEKNSAYIKSKILAFLYEVGQSKIDGKSVVDHLNIRDDFSYWWMTILIEKSYSKTLNLYRLAQLFMIEQIIEQKKITRVILASNAPFLNKTIERFCLRKKIIFEKKLFTNTSKRFTLKRSFNKKSLGPFYTFAFFIRYIWQRRSFIKIRNKKQDCLTNMTIADYFFNFEVENEKNNTFNSRYWGGLTELLSKKGISTNWLHNYIQHSYVKTSKRAVSLLNILNKTPDVRHCALDEAINISVMLSSLKDYTFLTLKKFSLRKKIEKQFSSCCSNFDFWEVLKHDWLCSMSGPTAIVNCLKLNMCEYSLKHMSHQKIGIYLQENQAWEMAFIYAWKKNGHGELMGVPHSTVRYWDLRYFYDPRCYINKNKNKLPTPNKILVNGPVSKRTYLEGGYPPNQIVEVEALRYTYLYHTHRSYALAITNSQVNVLVCCDYISEVNTTMFEWLQIISSNLSRNMFFTIKPHPAQPIHLDNLANLQFKISNAPLATLLQNTNIVYASNITSASADAYVFGLPVIQALSSKTFNMSPLIGLAGVIYVTCPKELNFALNNTQSKNTKQLDPFFYLDPDLPRWKKALGLNSI
ncbi:MAG: hypothetical protein P1U63_02645 [Coxiellaceae bacterium]|nr:hypothetical protein [Coxiellaceae bacterium]